MTFGSLFCLFILFAIVLQTQAVFFWSPKAPRLGQYNIDLNSITVSGVSSGAAFATQFHFAHSSVIKGSGVFAGGCYACAYENILRAVSCLQAPSLIDLGNLISLTDTLSSDGFIDSTENLKSSKAFVFHGIADEVVRQKGGIILANMYEYYGADVLRKFDLNANHGQPVDGNGYGGPCNRINLGNHYVNECGYNGAYEMLNWLYGNLTRPEKGYVADGYIVDFDQREFFSRSLFVFTSMAASGFIYVPKNCVHGLIACRLHIAFHGCLANEQYIGKDYATKSGYDEVAELNNIIVLYPQAAVSILSPLACWDWVGYTGFANYLTKSGVQINGVYKMIKRIIYRDFIVLE